MPLRDVREELRDTWSPDDIPIETERALLAAGEARSGALPDTLVVR